MLEHFLDDDDNEGDDGTEGVQGLTMNPTARGMGLEKGNKEQLVVVSERVNASMTKLEAVAGQPEDSETATSMPPEQIDREAFDEELHHLTYLLDLAHRTAGMAERGLSLHHATRLRFHLTELRRDCANALATATSADSVKAVEAIKVAQATAQHIHDTHVRH
ncbi:hypothetical protein OAN61_00330 [bacterium]|nr:hypothetical protein [bacterium]